MRLAAITFALCLVGCAEPQIIYRPVPVPAGLTQTVPHTRLPDPKTATQRDVALYLIGQHEALEMCNARLEAIQNWSAQWTR